MNYYSVIKVVNILYPYSITKFPLLSLTDKMKYFRTSFKNQIPLVCRRQSTPEARRPNPFIEKMRIVEVISIEQVFYAFPASIQFWPSQYYNLQASVKTFSPKKIYSNFRIQLDLVVRNKIKGTKCICDSFFHVIAFCSNIFQFILVKCIGAGVYVFSEALKFTLSVCYVQIVIWQIVRIRELNLIQID